MNEKKYELYGHRYMGKIRKSIPTDAEVSGDKVHVSVRLKSSKVKEYYFDKQDVTGFCFRKKFLWYMFDFVLMAVLVLLALAGISIGSIELVAGAVVIAVIAFGICARCQQLVISVKSGSEVCIPISDAEDASEFVEELGL